MNMAALPIYSILFIFLLFWKQHVELDDAIFETGGLNHQLFGLVRFQKALSSVLQSSSRVSRPWMERRFQEVSGASLQCCWVRCCLAAIAWLLSTQEVW